jgi:hypothetical protein
MSFIIHLTSWCALSTLFRFANPSDAVLSVVHAHIVRPLST